MLTRRNFLRLLAASLGSVIASACERAPIPTSTPASSPAPRTAVPPATETATPLPTATAEPTATATVTASPTRINFTATATPAAPEFVTARGDQFYYRGARFPIKGFNYYPKMHPWRTFNIGRWEPQVTERELKLGVGLGANVVRTFIDHNYSFDQAGLPFDQSFAPNERYINNLREFLDIAGRLNLKVIVTLFDSLNFAMYQPQNHWLAEEYIKAVVPQFADDPRIFCWDLQNEPDQAVQTVGAEPVLTFFKRVARQTRVLDPNHLQTIGWIDRARAKYFPDLNDWLDFWCFHYYDKADLLSNLVKFYKTQIPKPVLLEEFGLPTGGPGPDGRSTENDQAAHYKMVLTTLEENKMCGSAFWILLDFPVGLAGNPPITTDHPENHFGVFRLDYSEKPVCAVLRSFWRR
jgi:endo-1,4-beta-mannosidase